MNFGTDLNTCILVHANSIRKGKKTNNQLNTHAPRQGPRKWPVMMSMRATNRDRDAALAVPLNQKTINHFVRKKVSDASGARRVVEWKTDLETFQTSSRFNFSTRQGNKSLSSVTFNLTRSHSHETWTRELAMNSSPLTD